MFIDREAVILVERIKQEKIVAIFRHVPLEMVLKQVDLLVENGITIIEMTLNSNNALESIAALKNRYKNDICLGAGTVTTVEDVVNARDAGAEFIISPHMDIHVIKKTKELGLLSIPGASTPTEIFTAHTHGADMIKIFPASVMGVDYVKNLKGPYPSIPFMATGGIDEHNAKDYLAGGYDALGIGSSLTSVQNGDFEAFTRKVQAFKNL